MAAARSGGRLLYYCTSPRDRNYHYCEQHGCQQCYFTRWQNATLWESGKVDSVSSYGCGQRFVTYDINYPFSTAREVSAEEVSAWLNSTIPDLERIYTGEVGPKHIPHNYSYRINVIIT